jgi:hypothetical protein
MLESLNLAVEYYQAKWQNFIQQRSNQKFFKGLQPVTVGWKVADRQEYDRLYGELHEACDIIVETFMNGRWIAKMHLKDAQLTGGIEIIKIMQRRSGSNDALGLDHVDFYCPEAENAPEILKSETNLKWTKESNDAVKNYGWISVWFAGTEAKLKAYTVLDTVTQELRQLNREVIN